MEKKKNQYSKFIVAAVIVLNALFAAAVLIVFYHTSSEPSTLVGAWFTFTTTELLALSSIKKVKEKGKGEKHDT